MEEAYGSPDTLQDLCLFYCMNKLDVLHASLKAWQTQNGDISPTFPMMLGNNMLNYFLSWGVYNKDEHVNDFLKNSQLCNVLDIRRRFLSEANVLDLAQNSLRDVTLAVFTDDSPVGFNFNSSLAFLPDGSAYKYMIERSKDSLACIKLFVTLTGNPQNVQGHAAHGRSDNKDTKESKMGPLNALSRFLHRRKHDKHCGSDVDAGSPTEATKDDSDNHLSNLKSFAFTLNADAEMKDDARHIHSSLKQFISVNTQLKSLCIVSALFHPLSSLCHRELPPLQNLQSLVLTFSDTREPLPFSHGNHCFQFLCHLKQLRHLDVSFACVGEVMFKFNKDQVRSFIEAVQQLSQLQSLEVAGTNLDQIAVQCHFHATDQTEDSYEEGCQILGPSPLADRKLQYLGLFNCHASKIHDDLHVPASKVSGARTEEQLLVAVWTYTHNKAIMIHVLKHLKFRVQMLSVKNPQAFIEALVSLSGDLLDWRSCWIQDVKLLEEYLSCLFQMVRLDPFHISMKNRRALLQFLCVVMKNCLRGSDLNAPSTDQMARITILLMIKLNVINVCSYSHQFEKFVQLMMDIARHRCSKKYLKQLALRVLHELCRISQHHKYVAGCQLKLIKFLLELIQQMINPNFYDYDDTVEKQWSILWTLTDEVPLNCEEFLNQAGMRMVEECIKKYDDYTPMCRKITGAMSNVSENAHLRPQLMTPQLVQLFRHYLEYHGEEDYDVSSHAASFLVLLASDGPQAWSLESPTRGEVLAEVDDLIRKWDINKSKGVKFRSLQPMLSQIQNRETPVAQYWGAWMIGNLILVKPQSYCPMLKAENGLAIIRTALQDDMLTADVRQLLEMIMHGAARYRAEREQN